jgi:YecR-like lipoprotein
MLYELVKVATIFIVILAGGCAVAVTPQATGGSKADGIVKLSYIDGPFTDEQVDWSAGKQQAIARCQAWGYQTAEPFVGSTSVCNLRNGDGNCMQSTVTVEFQCMD